MMPPFACVTTIFWAMLRTAEFVVPMLKVYDPSCHIAHIHVREETDRNGYHIFIGVMKVRNKTCMTLSMKMYSIDGSKDR